MEQIDFEHHVITVDRQLIRHTDDQGNHQSTMQYSTKTGGIRYVHMNDAAESYIKQELTTTGKSLLPEELVFTNSEGKPLSHRSVSREFCRICAKLDIKAHIHTLRHTAASNMYHESKDIRFVQEQLGHSDQRTTYYYTHTRFEDLVNYNELQNEDFMKFLPAERVQQIQHANKQNRS